MPDTGSDRTLLKTSVRRPRYRRISNDNDSMMSFVIVGVSLSLFAIFIAAVGFVSADLFDPTTVVILGP
jgi:hypothetical protein